jgi:hypothetical protein
MFVRNEIRLLVHYPLIVLIRGAGAMGAAGATSPVAQTLRGQHGSNRLPFLPENCTSKFVYYSQQLEFRTFKDAGRKINAIILKSKAVEADSQMRSNESDRKN